MRGGALRTPAGGRCQPGATVAACALPRSHIRATLPALHTNPLHVSRARGVRAMLMRDSCVIHAFVVTINP